MEGLINVQLDISNSINRAFINFKKSPKDRITKEYLEVRIDNLERDWKLFRANNSKLYEISQVKELETSKYVENEVYEHTEDAYFTYKSLMKVTMNQFSSQALSSEGSYTDSSSNAFVKLPKITIPIFSGKYSEWPTFRDLFVSLVHNNATLQNVQKLHYLKGHLTGEAEQLVRHTPITDANYNECWTLLTKRYNNKKYLANCILKRLFTQKRINVESASALKDILDTTIDCLNALKNIGIDVSTWDVIIIHIVAFKLDSETRKQWELSVSSTDSNELPTLDQFQTFIESRFRALECFEPKKPSVQHTSGSQSQQHPKVLLVTNNANDHKQLRCEYCSEGHKLCFCKGFAKQDYRQRREFVIKKSICFNCLGSNHTVYDCKKPTTCKICNKRHHSLLHPSLDSDRKPADVDTTANTRSNSAQIVSCLSTGQVIRSRQVLLATALVKAKSGSGKIQLVRALIDQGSQACFVTEATVQLLRLKKIPVRGVISGLGTNKSLISKHIVTLTIQTVNKPIQIKAYVLKNITSYLPERMVGSIDWVELKELPLADPEFNAPNKIDMLLGANIYSQILEEGMKKSPDGTLVAQNTTLGWILSGVVSSKLEHSGKQDTISVMHAQVTESELLKMFWEIEEVTSSKKMLTEEEERCEEIFSTTTKRTKEGRYIVKLPFKDENPQCKGGETRKIAIARLKALERKFISEPDLKVKYAKVINEYLLLDHMRLVQNNDLQKEEAVYLPHHAIVRNDKTTTQVRVVFNASNKNKNGVSLNDTLIVGPKLQADLRQIIMRWRKHPIVIVADIVKMYRQVRIAEEDNVFQRIVWRDDARSEIKDYELLTVTFGTASAPYLAVRALQQLACDEGELYPIAAPEVLQSFYMDDLMTGCSTVEEGLELYEQMTQLLHDGGFELQKWNSNNEKLMVEFNKDKESNGKDKGQLHALEINEDKGKKETETEKDNNTKILGLTWNRREDRFQYSVKLQPTTGPETKRSVISDIARLYDPLGWIAPTVIVAKSFIQKLWLSGIGWDDELPTDLKKEWYTYRHELAQLKEVQIPRWLGTTTEDREMELHGFCDASKLAYAAVVYLRAVSSSGKVTVSLLTAKTRVAPIKQISIPRLELCGAVLLTRLLAEISEVMNVSKDNVKAWTDSTVVLAWLNSHPSKWKTFVANRVSEVLTTLDSSQWYHVPTKSNPADPASRGVFPSTLAENKLWFTGPQFLRESNIPYNKPKDLTVQLEESTKSYVGTVEEDSLFARFSSLQRLIRVVAYCRRILNKNTIQTQYLKKAELDEALVCCIRKVQRDEFSEEIKHLKENGCIHNKSSKLKSLSPYIDDKGVMRVGGRLQKSQLAEETKHPIILSHTSHFSKLIVANAHLKTMHGGAQLMLNYLRTAYWIIAAKNLVKSHIHKCVTCVRHRANLRSQFMGSLPSVRCIPARSFLHSGVDYAGPIHIRTTKGRGHRSYKGYICLFVCMATRAIHLEVVSDMSSQAFIAAFRRFTSRRGHCAQLWSDNGTTFVGASKELGELKEVQDAIIPYLESQGTEWHFIPPHAPNFGGLWEAGVKSTKFHLKRVIGDSTLTFEEMCTLLTQVEACLNSRPICVIYNTDPSDPLPLTPGHFLIGEPLVSVPDANYETSNVASLSRWQFIQKSVQNFWRRWSQEYLSTMLQRHKWTSHLPEPNEGDVVLIKEDDLPPSRWLLGRILQKHPGHDNVTRVVTLKTKSSTLKRPVSKVCVLPVSN